MRAQDPQPSVVPAGRTDTLRVLVVDDHPDVRLIVRRLLACRPCFEIVGEAADGIEAIVAAQDLQPDVVLLDLAMPRMDGEQALPGIVAAARGAMVTVFSASVTAERCDELQAIGAFRCYDKLELPHLPAILERDHADFLARRDGAGPDDTGPTRLEAPRRGAHAR